MRAHATPTRKPISFSCTRVRERSRARGFRCSSLGPPNVLLLLLLLLLLWRADVPGHPSIEITKAELLSTKTSASFHRVRPVSNVVDPRTCFVISDFVRWDVASHFLCEDQVSFMCVYRWDLASHF